MHRLVWLAIPLLLAACGGGSKSAGTLTVTCEGHPLSARCRSMFWATLSMGVRR